MLRKTFVTTMNIASICVLALLLQSYLVSQDSKMEPGVSAEPRLEVRRFPENGTQEDGTLLEEYTVLLEDGKEYKHGRHRKWLKDPYVLVMDGWYYKGKNHGPQFVARSNYHVDEDAPDKTYPSPRYKREFYCVDGKIHGEDRSYYANGRVSDESEYEFGEQLWSRMWYPDGSPAFSMDHAGDGYRRTWYESGQLKSEHQVRDGDYHGVGRTWFPNGQLERRAHYRNHVKYGPYVEWYESGQRKVEGEYHGYDQYGRNKEVGEWKYWDEDGELIRTEDHGDPPEDDESDD